MIERRSARAWWAAAFLLAVLPGAIRLVSPDDLDRYDQGRQALYVIDALDGSWLTPRDPVRISTKPPLYTWAAALPATLLGPSEFAVRLPALLASIGVGLLTFAIGRRLVGGVAALLAVALLAAATQYAKLAFLVRTDMLLTLWTTLALWALVARAPWTFASAVGLALLTKGPVGLAIPLGTVLLVAAIERDRSILKRLRLVPGMALALGLFAAWLVPALLYGGDEFWETTIRGEVLDRMTGAGSRAGQESQPLWHLLPHLVQKLLPFSLLVPFAYTARAALSREARVLLGSWIVVGFVVVSLPATKRADHLLPVYPAVMLLAAAVLQAIGSGAFGARRRGLLGVSAWAWCVAVGLAGPLLLALLWADRLPDLPRPGPWAALAAFGSLATLGVAWHQRVRLDVRIGAAVAGQILLVLIYWQLLAAPARLQEAPAIQRFAEEVRRQVGSEALAFHELDVRAVKFYLGRNARDLDRAELEARAESAGRLWVVMSRTGLEAWRESRGPAPGEPLARSGSLRDWRGKELLLVRLDRSPAER